MLEPISEPHIYLEAAIKLVVALLCGLALGAERQRKDKPAGLRTIVLITVGSTLFMVVSTLIGYVTDWPSATVQVDPSRIAAQVVTGIGFLGGGSILRARGSIQGLTTAATIWVASGIGLAIGLGFPLLALGVTAVVLVVLVALDPIARWLSRRGERRTIELIVPNDRLYLERLETMLLQNNVDRDEVTYERHTDEEVHVKVMYPAHSADASYLLLDALARMEGVRGARHFV